MAQLDSASDSDSDGWRFESVWVRHTKTFAFCKGLFFAYQTDSVPVANAIDTSRNNCYYAHFARYKSAICTFRLWTLHKSLLRSLCSLRIRLGAPFQDTRKRSV